MTSIKTKLLVVLQLVALVPLISLGAVNFFQTTDIFKNTVQDYLLTIVKSKEDSLENYIETTETIGKAIAESDLLQEYIVYTNRALTTEEKARFNILRKRVSDIIYSFQEAHWGSYHHIFLVDGSRKIVVSPNHGAKVKGSPSSHLNQDTSQNKWAMKAFSDGLTQVSDYSSWEESDHSHQMLFYPVKNDRGVVLAILGFELQIPHEEKILTENFKLGETGRVFLTTTDGVPIVYKGIKNQKPLNTLGVNEAKQQGYSSGLRKNSKNVEVIDLYLAHEKYPWILVAEIETQEAFQSLFSIQSTLIYSLLATFLIALILSILFANYIVAPIKKLTGQMEQISRGDFSVKIDDMGRKDEIGQLVQAFKRTVFSLKIAIKRLRAAKK